MIRNFFLLVLLLAPALADAQFVRAEIGINGLTCSMCSRATENQMRKLEFVKEVKMNLAENLATLTFSEDQKINLDELVQSVYDAGFSVREVKAVFRFRNFEIKDDLHFAYGGDQYHFIETGTRTLDGETTLRFLDKNFITDREFRKWSGKIEHACYTTGKPMNCCAVSTNMAGMAQRIYHVTIPE